ncbi:hypothetical protein [Paenibacillus odorifer]|uniref:Uncharacterized protein n=1 Tax=Paenibacillus odorifer TaxID=189426 RepID=A0A1R0XQY4_9BACL|nr:hypothetical protein [Paenibacillus odorifer]OMD37526.1 hypothetical protein BSK52_21260 [Paenibacillus odorifer]
MSYKTNERVRLAHEFFRLAYFRILSKEAYQVGEMLYWYIANLTGENTELVEDHFMLQINKKDLAQDLGYRDESAFRKRTAKRKGCTVWEELLLIGFEFKDGYHVTSKNAKKTMVAVPLVFDFSDWEKIILPSFFRVRACRYLEDLKSIDFKMKQISLDKRQLNWYEIDYKVNPIANFKVFDFNRASEKKIVALLLRQFSWVLAHFNIPFGDSENRKGLVANFNNMLSKADFCYEVVQRVFMKVSEFEFKEEPCIKDISAYIYDLILMEVSQLRAKERGRFTEDTIRQISENEEKWEQYYEQHFSRQKKILEKKISKSKEGKIFVLQKERENYEKDFNGMLSRDQDGRWYSYLTDQLNKAQQESRERIMANEAMNEQTLISRELDELICSNYDFEYDYLLDEDI